MLNSRNLSALLTLNVTQYAQTLLILTPTGQTLAYSSPSTLKTLRPTAAVAASTYISYNAVASNGTVAATLRDRPVTGDGAVRGGGERERVESVSVEFEGANLVVEWIKEGLLFAVLGPVAHPVMVNGSAVEGATEGSGSATAASSDGEGEADVVQQQEQQQHVPRESPLRILQLKSEGMVELLREELRGFSMPQEA